MSFPQRSLPRPSLSEIPSWSLSTVDFVFYIVLPEFAMSSVSGVFVQLLSTLPVGFN